jgi:hypothetical protein
MTDNSKFKGWELVLGSVKTPLGFFTLLALILDGVLLATAALTERISMLAPFGLLGLVIVFVFALVWKKPYALYHPRDWQTVTVNLLFFEPDLSHPGRFQEKQPIEVDLDVARCSVEIRDKEGSLKHRTTPNLTFDHGGWSFQLTEDVGPSDSVRLELVEGNERKWAVKPFLPYGTEQKALPKVR